MNDHATSSETDVQPGPLASADGDGTAMVPTNARAWGPDIAERLVADGAGTAAAADLSRVVDAGHSLGQWAARYMLVKVCGRSPNTLAAKTRDLATFIAWFVEHRGHGDIDRWTEAETRYFLRYMAKAGKRAATVNRALFTLKHFARWVHEQPGGVFARHGLPVAEVECLKIEEPECKKLSDEQMGALFAAARAFVAEAADAVSAPSAVEAAEHTGAAPTAKAGRQSRARPRRNLALLGVLYYSGLRVSEVIDLTRVQYDGAALYDVARKGGRQARKLVLHPECARLIDDYLTHERERERDVADLDSATSDSGAADASRPLFASARTGGRVDRIRIGRMLARLATRAATLPNYTGGSFSVHAHRLRHTFGAAYPCRIWFGHRNRCGARTCRIAICRSIRTTDRCRTSRYADARATGALTRLMDCRPRAAWLARARRTQQRPHSHFATRLRSIFELVNIG